MCLIIMNPAGESLPMEHIESGWSENPDGAGFMFVDDTGTLQIRKPFFKLKLLRAELDKAHRLHGASSPFVIHFRWATHGEKTEENTHPHSICGGQVGLVHNGVLHDFLPPIDEECSDTVWFCRTVLAYRSANHVIDDTFRKILAEMIGKGNKFVLLRNTREVSIVNESAGVWDNGRWYSNDTYKASRKLKQTYRPYIAYTGTGSASASGTLWDNGRPDEWDTLPDYTAERTEDIETELTELEHIADELDLDKWKGLTDQQQEYYAAVHRRITDLEEELRDIEFDEALARDGAH